jgi:hypothetical protein
LKQWHRRSQVLGVLAVILTMKRKRRRKHHNRKTFKYNLSEYHSSFQNTNSVAPEPAGSSPYLQETHKNKLIKMHLILLLMNFINL